MARSLSRLFYRGLLNLHPVSFRERFADEMLWIFDEVAPREGVVGLFGDVSWSLVRQWATRWSFQSDSPWPVPAQGLFAWERIAYPASSLPLPRMVQGSIVSFAIVVTLSMVAVGKPTLRPFTGDTSGVKDPRRMPQQLRAQANTETRPLSGRAVDVRGEVPGGDRAWVRDSTSHSWKEDPKSVFALDADSPGAEPLFGLFLLNARVPVAPASAQILTAQYDNARTGANLSEKILTPANVNAHQFGKLFTLKVDGDVYAQPLYLPSVEIPGKGKHNIVFIATENDSVYAFDADRASADPLWHASLVNSAAGGKPVSERDTSCFFIVPQVGITSTPVIDLNSGTLYVLARTKESKGLLSADQFKQRLHALAITTGAEKFGGPVEIKASVKGVGSGHSGDQVEFDPQRENPRAALLLVNDTVYLTWGSSCDVGPYHGWMMTYDARSLMQKAVFNTSPDASDSAIWQGDAGPAADQDGNVFVVTGNGEFDAATGGRDFGDTVLKLHAEGQRLTLVDYFTPSNQAILNERDNDLGSSGAVLLPDQPGPHVHLLVTAGKEGKIYVLDRDQMGKFQPGDDPHAVQTIAASSGAFGAMAYWNHSVFFIGSEGRVEDFLLDHGQLKLQTSGNTRFLDSGATAVISSNGSKDGIVWAASSKNWNEPPGRPAILYAYDAADVNREIYTSEQNGNRDRAGVALRFAMPSVANGKVYLGAKGQVDVYGLLPSH